jgi:hypothetical protein
VRSFQRDPTIGLTHNADFNRQVGDKRNNASQIIFLDSPQLLNRAYQTVMPYLSLAGMFNKNLAALLKGRDLPADLTWLAPMGTWSCVITPDEEGIQGYSVSGIGNQGIFLAGAMGATAGVMQTMGLLPKLNAPGQTPPLPANPVPPPGPIGSPSAAIPAQSTSADNQTNEVSPPIAPSNAMTNASSATAPAAASATNSAPTNSAPLTNSDATPPTPGPSQPH